MDSKKHSEITGSKAVISGKVGGKFSVWGGDLYGKNIEIIPDRKIVQSWRVREWEPEGYFSKVTFLIEEIKNGTRLTIIHEGIPIDDYEEIKEDWKVFYFEPMKEMIEA